VGELDRELLELMGDTTAAAVAEITERFKKLREAAEVEIARGGPRAAEAQEVLVKIKARIDLEEFRAKAEEFRREVEEIREEFGRREQTIQLRVDTGVVSDIGGRREIIAVHQEEAAALEAIIAKYPEMREEIEKLLPLIEDLKTTTDEFGKIAADAFETGLSDALADAAKGVKSLGEAAEDFLQSITDALLDWAAQQIASQMRDIIFGSLPQFGAGALGGLFKSAGGGTNLEEISVTTARLPEIGGEAGAAAAATALTTAGTTLTTGATALTTGATTLTTGATTFVTGVTSLVTAGSTLTAAGAALTAAAAALTASAATDAAGGLSEIIISTARLAEGGKVFGPGTGTSDSIPAMLSAGEFVVKAQAVQKPGVQYLLEKINDGAIFRGFAEGGYTGPPRFTVSRYADGGLVQPTAALAAGTLTVTVPPQQEERRPTIVQQSITVNAPGGNISKPTEMQITAATARGVRVADRHNN
jgi:hypothetical protein